MKNWMKFGTLGLAGTLLFASAYDAEAQSGRRVWVTIYRVAQLDDLDKPTPIITKDRADFYAQIWINGDSYTSEVMSTDDGKPGWSHSVYVTGQTAKIRIKLCDDDGGLENEDDYVDINPKEGKKDLEFNYNTRTRRMSGEVSGRRGQTIIKSGGGDSSQGKIWFTVKSS